MKKKEGLKIIEYKRGWFTFKRVYSELVGYIDIAILDQSENPNNNKSVGFKLNTNKTWVRSNKYKWECLIYPSPLYVNLELLGVFTGLEVYNLIVKENTRS